jgi:hypothetical protein
MLTPPALGWLDQNDPSDEQGHADDQQGDEDPVPASWPAHETHQESELKSRYLSGSQRSLGCARQARRAARREKTDNPADSETEGPPGDVRLHALSVGASGSTGQEQEAPHAGGRENPAQPHRANRINLPTCQDDPVSEHRRCRGGCVRSSVLPCHPTDERTWQLA